MKNPWSIRQEPTTHMTVLGLSRTQATLVEGECSHNCAKSEMQQFYVSNGKPGNFVGKTHACFHNQQLIPMINTILDKLIHF